jgi:hypothetical protein
MTMAPIPIAFMVMPFGVKRTSVGAPAPVDVDFDALWAEVHQPVLQEMGYQAVRADQDIGALIIAEMVQRLTQADLVVADVSLPNANVYYEIGVRHAAQRVGCVLVAADWASPTFDLAQLRRLQYPMPDGRVRVRAARAARATLSGAVGELAKGSSPVFDAVPGYPGKADTRQLSAFREAAEALSEFDADLRSVRTSPRRAQRARAEQVLAKYGPRPAVREFVALALLRMVRDHVGWPEVLLYIDELPKPVARHPFVVEQRCLAVANTGDAVSAAADLEAMIVAEGPTPERLGLLGGRYKQLWREASSHRDQRRYLDLAIESYERGMQLDLNQYYCSSNLARLFRSRRRRGDDAKAHNAHGVTMAACRRALELGVADEWVRPTLLAAAFDGGDVAEARRALSEVEREGADTWQLTTTMADLKLAIDNQADSGVRTQLTRLLARTRKLGATA